MRTCYQFDEFQIDPMNRRLSRQGEALHIGGRAFDLLHALVRQRGRVVSKEELMETVWPGTYVETNNLQVQVFTLRRLLGNDAIVTVARRGYQFMLPVRIVEVPVQASSAEASVQLRDVGLATATKLWRMLQRNGLVWLVSASLSQLEARATALAEQLVRVERRALWHADARLLAQADGLPDSWLQRLIRAGGLLMLHGWKQGHARATQQLEQIRREHEGLHILVTTVEAPPAARDEVFDIDGLELGQATSEGQRPASGRWGLRAP